MRNGISYLKIKALCKVRIRCSVRNTDGGCIGIIGGGERWCLELLILLISALFWK